MDQDLCNLCYLLFQIDLDHDPYESGLIRIGRGTIPFPRDMDRVPDDTDRFAM
jgi:hypothetical protein